MGVWHILGCNPEFEKDRYRGTAGLCVCGSVEWKDHQEKKNDRSLRCSCCKGFNSLGDRSLAISHNMDFVFTSKWAMVKLQGAVLLWKRSVCEDSSKRTKIDSKMAGYWGGEWEILLKQVGELCIICDPKGISRLSGLHKWTVKGLLVRVMNEERKIQIPLPESGGWGFWLTGPVGS